MRLNLTDNFEIQRARNFEILLLFFWPSTRMYYFKRIDPGLHQRLLTVRSGAGVILMSAFAHL